MLNSIPFLSTDSWKPKVALPLSSSPFPFIIDPPNLVLKPLSNTLKYEFLGSLVTLPIIIASKLDDIWQHQLISVLQEHKEVIGWTIANIKGISLSMVMQRIQLEETTKASKHVFDLGKLQSQWTSQFIVCKAYLHGVVEFWMILFIKIDLQLC